MATLPPVLILGAGKTGRGLAAVLAARAGAPVWLVDRDPAVVAALRARGSYPVEVLGTGRSETIPIEGVFALDDPAWPQAAAGVRLVFTAVFGPNLPALAPGLVALLQARGRAGGGALDCITCENHAHAAQTLRTAVQAEIARSAASPSLLAQVGFVEAMVLTTALAPAPGMDPLLVRTQNAFRLPCDAEGFAAGAPPLPGLEPLAHFRDQLVRKIFTYNAINAVISYVGAERGYRDLASATADPTIRAAALQAGQEASAGLIATYGFDAAEQGRWVQDALAKFADPAIPDPITRNAADPARKLAREDRLVGPAALALAHGVTPTALVQGIRSACRYRDGAAPDLLASHGGYAAVLAATAKLPASDALVRLVQATPDLAFPATRAGAHG